MTLGEVAGLIAALAFVALVGLLAVPVLRLGRVFQEATRSVKELTDHTLPILDEAATTVAETNAQLEKVDTITTAAADVSQNVSALTALFSATLGGPLIKLAAFTYGVRTTVAGHAPKKGRRAKSRRQSSPNDSGGA
jgi:predicted PurR-regulated permease PerM